MKRTIALATAVALFAISSASDATIIDVAKWDLQGEDGDQVSTAGTSDSTDVAVQDVARGPGINPSGAANSISANGWDSLDPDEDYFTFGFTVDPGLWVDLDALFIGTRSSNTGPGDLGLFYSGDGFTNSLHTFTQSGTSFLNSEVDLSGLTELTGTVEFRIIAQSDTRADGNTGITSGGTLRITNFFGPEGDTGSFRLTGTVVPEPASVVLMLLAGMGLAFVGRRRAR